MSPASVPLPDALCKVASTLTSSLPDTEFPSSSIVAFTCCNKTWSLRSHLGALCRCHSVFLGVWDTMLLPSPANQQMGMYSSAYLQTGPPSTYLGPCHWSLTDANGQIGLPSKKQKGRWETSGIMCMDLKATYQFYLLLLCPQRPHHVYSSSLNFHSRVCWIMTGVLLPF